ncbi:MAG: relaxase domain-containing protein [Verrucomicrobiales bacterium]|nr:relaxase domain-containing protein [Verrucomicrobiales bacterium]
MLSAKAQYSLRNAKGYFEEHLRVGDYYSEGHSVSGECQGLGAEMLGLSGETHGEQFVRLCENLHPQTGERLTLRQKTTRRETGQDGEEHESANRRVFYDFTFSPPKSVSIAALVNDDRRIVEAHQQAVASALNQLQVFAATRVRKNGQCSDRTTGNIVAAVFQHDTSRALDPHLHSHCIVFNATFDAAEGQWKALQNYDMLVAQKFVENVYYHELARELRQSGYGIENKPRGDFELQGISDPLIEKFSKRHQEIDARTRELLEREPEKAKENLAAVRENIAHKERARKMKDVGLSRLREMWASQLTIEERESLRYLTSQGASESFVKNLSVENCIAWAEEHLFDRRSVVHEHELWRHALEYARGQSISLKEIQSVTGQREYVRDENYPGQVTTREHLQREWDIVCIAEAGQGRFEPLCQSHCIANPRLDAEQIQAVQRILQSRDLVTLFRGGAGTGKSFTLREIQQALEQAGYPVCVIAPQRQQVMDLEKDGFENVETVSAFLASRALPIRAVVLVDETGQIGGKQMQALLQYIQSRDGRAILSGDTRQHGAVEATDALRAIEKYSGLRPVELSTIRRQNPDLGKSIEERKRIKEYRRAVAAAQNGKLAESFDRLDRMGGIVSCSLNDQHEKLAERYLELIKDKQSTVVVSQSWNEIHSVNAEIRAALKEQKLIGDAETALITFQPMNFTEAQKRDVRSYGSDTVLVFNRNVRGFKAGDCARLRAITATHLTVESNRSVAAVPLKFLDRLTVRERRDLALSPGDRLQLKANGLSENNRKLANGELVTVKTIHDDGRIALADGRILPKSFRQFVRGYAVTSYASQGKSVNYVLFSDSAVKAATSHQQWYVTISRGKKGVQIFTPDKIQLRQNIARSGDRALALDIAKPKEGFAQQLGRMWKRAIAYTLNVEHSQRESAKRHTTAIESQRAGEQSVRQTGAAPSVHPTNGLQPKKTFQQGIRL